MSDYTKAVNERTQGLDGLSVGVCPGCETCMTEHGYDDKVAFYEAVQGGEVFDEGSFSSRGCGICGSKLGGHMYTYHYIDETGEIIHGDDCCVDCLMYLANGDEPEHWEG